MSFPANFRIHRSPLTYVDQCCHFYPELSEKLLKDCFVVKDNKFSKKDAKVQKTHVGIGYFIF